MSALNGEDGEKRLALQFIIRFTKHFPQHADRVIEAHIDMCEDPNVTVSMKKDN